jgi:Na+-translocating ferredoxin:NAD+ oxidoreductase RnfC subunit
MQISAGVTKGITLEQNKEPALSREIRRLPCCENVREKIEGPLPTNPGLLAPYEIVLQAIKAQIIDSDGRRLSKKLTQAAGEGISGIMVDAIDDEPYISSQLGPMLWYSDEMLEGISLAQRAVGSSKVVIEVYKNLFDIDTKIPASIGKIHVARVGGKYPAWYRTRRKGRREKALFIGSCALIHLRRAIYTGEIQKTCFITVAGDCVIGAGNYEVPIGITVAQVLEQVGTVANPKRIIAGGSMTGFGVKNPEETYITPTTRGVLAFADDFHEMGFSCIGCGRCIDVCPAGLSPCFIYQDMQTKRRSRLALLDADRCIGCGTCSYICPAKLDIAQTVQEGARLISGRGRDQA